MRKNVSNQMRLWVRAVCAALVVVVILQSGFFPAPVARAQAFLGTAQTFGVLGGSTVTNTGPTVVDGNVGVWPGLSITGFPPGVVVAPYALHLTDAVAQQAQSDTTTAYNTLAGLACDVNLTGQDLGGQTLTPGVYCFASSAQLTGDLQLDAQGDSQAVFVFQMGSTLTTASNSSVTVINGGQDCNVSWQVGSSAILGTGTEFVGNILAMASITLNTSASLSGRALARSGAVTLDSNAVSIPPCSLPVTPTGTSTPGPSPTATNTPTTVPSPTATATVTPGPSPTPTPIPVGGFGVGDVSRVPDAGLVSRSSDAVPLVAVIVFGMLAAILVAVGVRQRDSGPRRP